MLNIVSSGNDHAKCNSKAVSPFIPLETCQIVPSRYQRQVVQHKGIETRHTLYEIGWELAHLWTGQQTAILCEMVITSEEDHEQEDEATDGAPTQSKLQVWPLLSPVIKGWRGLAHYRTWTRRHILQKEYNLTLVHQFELPLIQNVKLQKII
ncbi:unnamed protein product [Sphagnum jensenii]